MSNFGFIRGQWPELFDVCQRAESYALSDPDSAAFHARVAVEKIVAYLFVDVFGLPEGYRSDLSARMNDTTFKNRTYAINNQLNLLRRRGNDAAHGNRRLSRQEGVATLRDLFDVIVWTVKHQSTFPEAAPLGTAFDVTIVQERAPLRPAELAKLAKRFTEQQEASRREIAERDDKLSALEEELEALRKQIADAKAADTAADIHDYREAETRTDLIDDLLRDAGWALEDPEDREYPVDGLPVLPGVNESGTGRVDYVLWGQDGRPLGLVEAKRTSRAPSVGARQAQLYADALERRFGQRPVIFLTNGRQHEIWDDAPWNGATGYPARAIEGFYTRGELEQLHHRRTQRRPLSGSRVDPEIAGRPYQQRAIAKVGAHFDAHQRRALLVMATGTGKTRTAIALVDQLMERGWVKRVLFLADRTALVRQAHKAFSKLLPGVASIDLTSDKHSEARVHLATYPTMMNLVDAARDGEERRFGPGYFDLVIIDEAHRSVYQKYGALFDWFDGLLLGLTATPVDDIARSTYRLFELEPGVPTDSYPLEEAIGEGYLVGPENLVYDLGFHRSGIRYDQLSEEEKEQWEEIDWDEGEDSDPLEEMPTAVEAPRVFRSLFNADTADKALAELMRAGHHVAGGDRLGKTIVFAMNQRHAQFLKERFDAQYPHLGGDFAQVITSDSAYAQDLIESFSISDRAPHIAISVDMLDTGIDVPEVLNLVLFKQVLSKTKFWQMIGRGTRLCPDVHGDGVDKTGFRVFDFCGNVEYFGQDPADRVTSVQKPLSHRLFATRARIVAGIDLTAGDPQVREAAVDWLSTFVSGIPTRSFLARKHGEAISRYSRPEGWAAPLGRIDAEDAAESLGSLPSAGTTEDEHAKRFDLLVLRRELAQLEGAEALAERTRSAVQDVASQLLEKQTIPQVAVASALLQEVAGEDWWEGVTLAMLERARRELRSLAQFLDARRRWSVVTDFEDYLGEARSADLPLVAVGVDQARFREKVTAYIHEHRDHVAIQRLRRNLPLTETDLGELERILVEQGDGTPEALAALSGERGLGVFVRSLVGLDRAAAESAFADKIALGGLNSTQQEFLTMVIDELTRRGEMEPRRLYQSPYEDRAATRIDFVFPKESDADAVITVLHDIERAAAPIDLTGEKSLA